MREDRTGSEREFCGLSGFRYLKGEYINMKKQRKLLLALTGICILLLGGCGQGQKLGEAFAEEVNTLEGAALRVDQASPTGISFTIQNQTDKDLSYGQDYHLQKQKDGTWYVLEPENPVAVTLEMLWLPAGGEEAMTVEWKDSYGELPKGNYRFVKNFSDEESGYYLAGEFTLE